MLINKKHIIFLAVMLVAMMSVAVAADVNDSNTESTTPAITPTIDNTNVQTSTLTSNEITKKANNNIENKTNNKENTRCAVININNDNFDDYVTSTGLTSLVNECNTLNFTSDVTRTNSSYVINDTININGNGFTLDLNTINGYGDASNPTYIEFNSYANNSFITNLKFHNTQVFTTSASNIVFDNINVTVDNQGVGKGTGYFAMRTGVSNITVKNSYFYAANNTGCSAVVITFGENCTIDNNTIIGQGTVGNLVYLNQFGQSGNGITQNKNNTISNNIIIGPDEASSICHAITIGGPHNHIINNTINYTGIGIVGNWAGTYDPETNTTNDYYNDTYVGNGYINNTINNGASFSGAQYSLVAGNNFTGPATIQKYSTVKNNRFDSSVTIYQYSNVTNNKFNSTVTLKNNINFKNNNAENSTLYVNGSNCDLCNDTVNTIILKSGITNTSICLDMMGVNIVDNGCDINWYSHPSSLTLTKKSSRSLKTDDNEPNVIDITEENFTTYFNQSNNTKMNAMQLPLTGDTIFNLYYVPSNQETIYIVGSSSYHLTFIGKNNLTLKNVLFRLQGAAMTVKDINFIFDEDVDLLNKGVSFMWAGIGPATPDIMDNITVNYNGEYEGLSSVIKSSSTKSKAIVQNSVINANVPAVAGGYSPIQGNGISLINNTITINEKYAVNDTNNSLSAITLKTQSGYPILIDNNNITVIGESDLVGIIFDESVTDSNITNNNITIISTEGTATGVELTGNDNTVTDNYIVANDKYGDSAVTATGENNIVENNAPLSTSLKVIAPATANINEATPITILLKDNTGKLIPEQEVKVTVGDNQTETVTTDEDGIAVYNLTATVSGELNLTITYEGQGVYTGSETTVTINVNEDKDAIIAELNNTIKEQEETIGALNGTVNNQSTLIKELNSTVDSLNDTVQTQNNTINEQNSTINRLNDTVNAQESNIKDLSDKLNTTAKDLEAANKKVDDLSKANTDLNNKLNNTAKDLETANDKIDNLTKANKDLADNLSKANNDINNLTQANKELNNSLVAANKKVDDLAKANDDLAKQLNDTNKKVDEIVKNVDNLITQLNNTQDKVNNLTKEVADKDKIIKELTTKKATKITVDKVNTTSIGSSIVITGKLTDTTGTAINNMPVSIKINSASTKVVTNANGVYKYTTTARNTGTNNVTVSATANDKYTTSSAKTTFKVNKANPTLKLNSITAVKFKDKVTVTGSLMDNTNKAISSASITLKINKKSVTVKTAKDGSFTYTTTATTMGTNNITATYNGNTKYNKATTKTTFKVAKQNIILTVDRVASGLKYKDPLVVGGRLVDANNKAVANTQVSLKFNGKTYKAKTDKNGYYKVTTRATTMGTNNITATYDGNTNYNKAIAKTSFTVAKQDIIITFDKVSYANGKVTISGTFTDRNRHALMNSLARITLNGKQGTAKTNNKGTFTYTTKAKQGTYKVTLAYPGNDRYNAYSKTSTVKTA
ncbi:MAG: Ig-like domain repeat protein [Methanosphaera sp.]|nr:Ig-like domain repeat protein [Methanosphaera sp.]